MVIGTEAREGPAAGQAPLSLVSAASLTLEGLRVWGQLSSRLRLLPSQLCAGSTFRRLRLDAHGLDTEQGKGLQCRPSLTFLPHPV